MVRRIASQVHKQVSRLMQANYIREEPLWYQAVLQYPPLPLPSRATPFRALDAENPTRKPTVFRPPKMQPSTIRYLEDKLRLQFFRDHPFEAFRPVSIVEGQLVEPEHPVRGKDWSRLSQRTKNPTAEDAVLFAANLHTHHKVSLTVAYTRAVAEFRTLRAEYDIANAFARMEAEAYGTVFPSEVDRTFEKEDKVYKSVERKKALDESALRARKRWRAILNLDSGMGNTWSRGQEYIRRQEDGVRPSHIVDDSIKPPSSPSEEQLFGSR
ncbi:mitochondrial ribosomal protein S25-domain-containing protein [Boletus edulis BED1]|uniref:Small ribosomal subunit protein mS23 n=1 Tax=Boletus edulis BED1 TaxID=1328754 RepID=A0AAD4C1X9_BOLED|nr:mitochondrial ribosomal protein S25-domain-containing protein [Boletus edulis BED1]